MFLVADLMLGIGCRFIYRHTGALPAYRGELKFIQISTKKSEIGKIFPVDLGIVSDAGKAIDALIKSAEELGVKSASAIAPNIHAWCS